MESLIALWLPILVSAVLVFLASSVVHMVLPIHRGDHAALPSSDALEALADVPPGNYAFPYAGSMAEMGSPEFRERLARGPVGFLSLMPKGGFGMGRSLVGWFLFSLVVSLFCAYVAGLAAAPGAPYLQVFRVTGAVALIAYATADVHNALWKGGSWGTAARFALDGLVYALVTAGTFAWLWPAS
jgi:hypothetical protein